MAAINPKKPPRAPAARRKSPATITAADVERMSAAQARAILDDMPNLPTRLRVEGEPELAGALEARATAQDPPAADPPTKAAPAGAKDRPSSSRPRGSSRRRASGRRLASRTVRQTPGLPGPSATNLVLTFLGSTIAVIGLVLLLEGGPAFGQLPDVLGRWAQKLTDPTDPIF